MPTEGWGGSSDTIKTPKSKQTPNIVPVDTSIENGSKVVKTKLVKYDNLKESFIKKWTFNNKGELQLLLNWFKAEYYEPQGKFWLYIHKGSLPSGLLAILKSKADDFHKENKRILFSFPFKLIGPDISLYSQDDFYVIEYPDGSKFHIRIKDFNNWNLQNIKNWIPERDIEQNSLHDFIIESSNEGIQLTKDDKIVTNIPWEQVGIIHDNTWEIVIVHDNLIEFIQVINNGQIKHKWDSIKHNYGEIEKMKIDRNSNFLLFISSYGSDKKLHIVNRETLEEVKTFNDIVDIIQIDNKNDITCLDTDGNLVWITTNFDQFSYWFVHDQSFEERKVVEITDNASSKLRDLLDTWSIDVNVDDVTISTNQEWWNNHKDLVQKLWDTQIKDWNSLKTLFTNADSLEEIELVYQGFLQIKSHPDVSAVSGLTINMENEINTKRFTIKNHTISTELEDINLRLEELRGNTSKEMHVYFAELVRLKSEIASFQKARSQITVRDQELDEKIQDTKEQIEQEIVRMKIQNKEDIEKSIKSKLSKIENFLSNIVYLAQITDIYNTELYKDIESLVQYLEDDKKIEYDKELQEIIESRIKKISETEDNKRKIEEQNTIMEISAIESILASLETILASIDSEETLRTMEWNDSLVNTITIEIKKLPKSEAEKLQLHLESLFRERLQKIKLLKLETKWVIHSLDEYGIDTSLYYTEPKQQEIGFELLWHRQANGSIRLELMYDDGTIFNIDRYLSNPQKYSEGLLYSDINPEISSGDFVKLQKNYSEWKKTAAQELEDLYKMYNIIQNEEEVEEKIRLLKQEWLFTVFTKDWKEQKRSWLVYEDLLEDWLDKKKKQELIKWFLKNENETKEKIKKRMWKLRKEYKSWRVLDNFATHLATTLNLNPRSHLKLPNPDFIVLDEERDLFEKISVWLMIQKEEQKGIDILEWPPGLWKTMWCEFLWAVTNREVVRVQCSKMDPNDLFYSPQLKAWETSRQPAEWLKLMQKPGTLIIFDEIDKLNSQCFERLHSLFDGARSIYDPQIWSVKANEDCVFLGTRNSYEIMSNPIVSRSNIIAVNAPSEMNEAYKIARYSWLEFFQELSYDEFKNFYKNIGSKNNKWKIKEVLLQIKGLVKIFNALREKQIVKNYSDDKFEFEISYRDAEQIFFRYNRYKNADFAEILLEVIVPKARAVVKDFEDKDIQEKIVRDIISSHF